MEPLGITLIHHLQSRESADYFLSISPDTNFSKYHICTASVNTLSDPEGEIFVQTVVTDNGACVVAVLRKKSIVSLAIHLVMLWSSDFVHMVCA